MDMIGIREHSKTKSAHTHKTKNLVIEKILSQREKLSKLKQDKK